MSTLADEHQMSGWTRLPTTTLDFRRCLDCGHIETQERQPCTLCGSTEARAYEVPGYGLAYVCTPCLKGHAE
ncbi:hypothetical protein [Mycobacterium sp. PSTR-4-N]|uniref:hypothetical protein n=1 Tax=Mycobacterium sp. PSTR-4-N TaxID=2917745 RepID=UPI001F152658|nr:hypothetical protein [Mycobacterium sp. PSTR-4-N]MCG7592408.1 hypothetical protein [Mycobacterium sp. PSTR-4-N]